MLADARVMKKYSAGFTGTVETIFRLAEARHPERWAESAIPPKEHEVWRGLRDGWISVECPNIDQILQRLLEVPQPHENDLLERRCDIMDACDALKRVLDGARLQATYFDELGNEYTVPAKFWRAKYENVATALLSGWLHSESERDEVARDLIHLRETALEHVWPELVAHDRPVDKANDAPNIDLAAVSSVDAPRREIRAVKDSGLRCIGRPPTKGDRILAEMRKMDLSKLRRMKGKEMEHHFSAVRSTCNGYRKQVLAENGDN
jgi:hypothetical protein